MADEQPVNEVTVAESETIAEETSAEETAPENVKPPEPPSYRYPITLSDDHAGRIVFVAREIPANTAITELVTTLVKKTIDLRNKLDANQQALVEDPEKSNNNSLDAEGSEIVDEAANVANQLNTVIQEGDGEERGRVTLPLFRGIQFSDRANYNTTNLGVLGAGVENLLNGQGVFSGNGGQLTNAAVSLAGQQIGSILGGLAGGVFGGLSSGVVGALAGGDFGSGLGGAIGSATRISSAPNAKTLFKDVELRTFNFVFKMIAKNEEEAVEIKNIVKFFREQMYPEVIPFGENNIPFAYKYPNVFNIEIKSKDPKYRPAFRIQPCYLESVNTTFNQTATSLFEGKYFIEVDIQLAFKEIIALHKDKIKEGY